MTAPRRVLTALFLVLTAVLAHAQAYTSVVVFGDSLSDTGNDAHLSAAAYTPALELPGPGTGYTPGRFTDGTVSLPPAILYHGVWIEQFAAALAAKPAVTNSLDGGSDYAYGFAFTGSGTSNLSYGPGNVFSISVDNMETQLASYLATHPTITNQTLFVVWGGANDLLKATSSAAILTAASNEVGIVQSLIAAGATDFIIPNLPPLGAIPRLNRSPTDSATATAASVAFNQALAAGLATLPASNPGRTLHLYPLDVFTLFENVIASPSTNGLVNVTDSSQGTAVDPDTYLFWDSLHPTTAVHHLLSLAALALIAPSTTTTILASSSPASNLNASVTFTATVAASSGTPTGTVTFYDGATALDTAQLSGTSADTATYTTSSLSVGTHTITAAFTASNYFNASTSSAVSEIVTAPAIAISASPVALSLTSGSSGTSTISLSTVGGYAGTGSLSCGTLPAFFSCSFAQTTFTFLGANNTLSTTLTVKTEGSTTVSQNAPRGSGSSAAFRTVAACSILPFFGFLAFGRRKLRSLPLLCLLLLFSLGAITCLSGCSGTSSINPSPGLYTIPVVFTNGGTTTSTSFVVAITK